MLCWMRILTACSDLNSFVAIFRFRIAAGYLLQDVDLLDSQSRRRYSFLPDGNDLRETSYGL